MMPIVTRAQKTNWTSGFAISACSSRSAPLERALLEQIQVADEQDGDEQHHLDQAVEPETAECDRPRVEEHRLDVEQDEQHRDEVELDLESRARVAGRLDAALVG